VKDLLLTLPNPSTLSQAIAQVVRCDNMFLKCQQERHHEPTLTTQRSFAPLTTQKGFFRYIIVSTSFQPTHPLFIGHENALAFA
jgi:hypothetical protein